MKKAESIAIETRAISVARFAQLARERSRDLCSVSRSLCRESKELATAKVECFRVLSAANHESGMKLADPACPAREALETRLVEISDH